MPTVSELAERLGKTFFDYQLECFEHWVAQTKDRLTLYYRTGAGKSITALSAVALKGYDRALVVAPPSTHDSWNKLGLQLGVEVEAISHSKFRNPTFKLSRTTPVIADEIHLFGGNTCKGWMKLDKLAANLKAPLIACSATPNYNDAERCYCIQHIMDPTSCRGGFLQFVYENCITRQNPYAMMPDVVGFLRFKDAEEYLASLPYVLHVPDNQTAIITDIQIPDSVPDEFRRYGLNRATGRITASLMEERFAAMYISRIDENDVFRDEVYDIISYLVGQEAKPVLLYCNSERVAQSLHRACHAHGMTGAGIVTGKNTAKHKSMALAAFKRGDLDILIGTATLATGTDGLNKVCDCLIIVNDTDDEALRKQLCGRILPRGDDADSSNKHIYRLVV